MWKHTHPMLKSMDKTLQKAWTWITIATLTLLLGSITFIAKNAFAKINDLENHTTICDTDRAKLNANVDNMEKKLDEISSDVKQILMRVK